MSGHETTSKEVGEGDGLAARPCPHCGSSDVVTGLRLNQNVEAGSFGVAYRVLGCLLGVEPIHVDLCQACGTLTRFSVKNTNRKWSR